MKTGIEIHHGKFSGTFVCPHRNLGFICVSAVTSHSTWLLFWEDVKGNWSGVVVRSEAEGPKLREGQGKKKRAQGSMRNKECWNEKSLGWGKGRALWKGSCGYQGKGEGGPEMCLQAPQPSTNVLQNENKSCLKIPFYSGWVKRNSGFYLSRGNAEPMHFSPGGAGALKWLLSQGPRPMNCKLESEHCSLHPSLHQWICH